jgi:hypothetical protein
MLIFPRDKVVLRSAGLCGVAGAFGGGGAGEGATMRHAAPLYPC